MDKDIKEKLIYEAKNNMPDMWGKIESTLDNKKKRINKRMVSIAAIIAVVMIAGGISSMFVGSTRQNENLADIVNNNEIAVLPDLSLESYISNKIILEDYFESSTAYDIRFINYKMEADNVVYGKVIEVNSYVDFGSMIFTDIKIEIVEDYKGNKVKGDTIILGNKGGELTYKQFIDDAYESIYEKRGYNNIEDKSKMFVELTDDHIPQYRVGEYVLVYGEELKGKEKTESYSQDKNGVRRPVSYDYYALKKLYVDPNTNEVFEYINRENNLIKNKVDTLENIKEFYR